MLSVFDEYYVEEIRRHTRKALEGKPERGFVAGNLPFGYKVVKVGDSYVDSRGRIRAQGSKGVIVPEQADVVRRVFKLFAEGVPLTRIVKMLNGEAIKTLKGKGWNSSTLSKMLRNEVYIGKYTWGKTTTKRDPDTGRKVKRPAKASAICSCEMPELRIVEQEVWDKVQRRRSLAPRTGVKGFNNNVSRNIDHPKYLLCGSMKCGLCGGAINLIGGKNSGYYGCQMYYQRKRCTNKRTVSRSKLESLVVSELHRQMLNPDAFIYILEGIQEEIAEQTKHIPEELDAKKRELEKLQTKIHNLIQFIAEGNSGQSVKVALEGFEGRQRILREQIGLLESAQRRIPALPSVDEIPQILGNMHNLLASNAGESARLIRNLIGGATLQPKVDEHGKEYLDYSAVLRATAVIPFFSEGGSDSLKMWTLWERIRTLAEVEITLPVFSEGPFAYQEIGPKAHKLMKLGMNYSQIAAQLQVSDKTVAKGIRYCQGLGLKPKLVGFKMPRSERRPGAGAFPFDDEGSE